MNTLQGAGARESTGSFETKGQKKGEKVKSNILKGFLKIWTFGWFWKVKKFQKI